jgi:hypothetical protein
MAISPTAEGFRAVFRRPSLTFAEISWRWCVGATATALFFFGLFEYLSTLPVSGRELLLLRSGQPYLVGQAILRILHGSANRAVMSLMVAALWLGFLWILAASLGRMATVRVALDYFRGRFAASSANNDDDRKGASGSLGALLRLNFLRAAVVLAAILGLCGAGILAGFASPDTHPQPGLAFLLFVPMAIAVALVGCALNWFLSLAGVFAARDGGTAVDAISAAVSFFREHMGAVLAVSTWTVLAHLVLFSGASTAAGVPLGMAGLLPGRIVFLGIVLLTLVYFALADWLYMARIAGYVCIAEVPEALRKPAPLAVRPSRPSIATAPPLQTTIDRGESILSDIPGIVPQS